jgi:hypothetical protein
MKLSEVKELIDKLVESGDWERYQDKNVVMRTSNIRWQKDTQLQSMLPNQRIFTARAALK